MPLAVPRTWVVGETVTAAYMNAEIRDQWNTMLSAWTDYTPSWIAETGGTPTVGNGSLIGRYQKIGRSVDFLVKLTVGSTTTFGAANANWAFGLPPSSSPSTAFNGSRAANVSFRLPATGEARGSGELSTNNSGTVRSIAGGSAAAVDNSVWDQSSPLTASTGLVVTISGRYESAA